MKRLPTLTNAQRRALLVIEWVLLIGIIVYSVMQWKKPSEPTKQVETNREWYGKPAKPFTYADLSLTYESIDLSGYTVAVWYTIVDVYGNTYETEGYYAEN